MTKSPFDFSEMMKAFDPAKMSKMFDPATFMESFQMPNKDAFDVSAIMDANKRNFDAMVKANESAAASYKDMLEKQMAIFDEVTKPAQEMMTSGSNGDQIKAQQEAFTAAVEEGLAMMKSLADATKDANEKAYEQIKSQVQEAVNKAKKL